MPFPSVAALASRAEAVLRRFTVVLACAAVAASAAIVAVDNQTEEAWYRLAMVAALGLPLTTALSLFAERRGLKGAQRTGLLAAGVLALAWFFKTWPGLDDGPNALRYFQLSAGLHLLVAFLPFLGFKEPVAFWHYNRRLFEGFLRAALFASVLYLGLAVALLALDKLLGLSVPSVTYARLWMLMALLVNTWIFLGGVPEDLAADEEEHSYPRGLKVFAQYILTPLVAVYLVILTAYLVKVVATGSWPSGWIGYLVASVAVTGLLGFLLVHPLRAIEEEGWIRTYARWLFIGLIPAAVMFLMALWKRVAPYGLTELRFLGLILGAWLLGIAILFSVRTGHGIRVIPVSLATLLLLTLYGPVSATRVSIRSQADRLRGLLEANQLVSRVGAAAPGTVTADDRREISAAMRFLLSRDAVPELTAAFGGKLPGFESPPDTVARYQEDTVATQVMTAIGLTYVGPYAAVNSQNFYFSSQSDPAALAISGYDYKVELSNSDSLTAVLGADTVGIVFDSSIVTLRLMLRGDTILTFPFQPTLDSLLHEDLANAVQNHLPPGRLRLVREEAAYRGMLALGWINGDRNGGSHAIRGWGGELYIGRIRP